MMQVGTNQSATYHSQPALSTAGGQAGRSSSTSRQQPQQSQYDSEQLTNIRPRICVLRKWPHYDGYGVHLARNQHWLGLRIGDVEPNSPAESGGLLREDVVLAVNGHSVENDDFFVILSFIQHELEADQIRFLVLDPHSADLARRHNLNIDENYRTCVRMETPTLTVSPEKLLYDQWRSTNAADPTAAQNTIHLGPTSSLNQEQTSTSAPHYQQTSPNDGRDDVYTFLPYSDTNNNSGSGPHMCSVILRPGESIGISLQQDKDFSHIIKHVEPNSPADLAGVERDDCIISLNDIPLLYVPYQEVLNTLKRSRNEPNLDFLVAKKSYLLKSNQNNNNTAAEVLPSSNIIDRNTSATVPPTQALEQLFNKYNNEQKPSYDETDNSNRARETVSTSTPNDRYDQRSPQFDNDRYPSKSQQGQILQGVGPATADRSSWGVSSGKSSDEFQLPASGDSSIRSTSRDQRPDADDVKGRNSSLEDSFKPLQVGFSNPTSSQQPGNATSNLNDDKQRTSRPISSNEERDSLPNQSRPADTNRDNIRTNQTIQNIPAAVPITPLQRDYDEGNSQTSPTNQVDTRLGPSKAMSVPSKPPKANVSSGGYTDTDDDLSDISEHSHEEDISDSINHKNPQSNLLESSTKPSFGNTSDSTDRNPNFNNSNRTQTSTYPNTDRQSSTSLTPGRTVVQARRIEKSDSDDTMSESDRLSLPSALPTRTLVQARRLDKTDSDDPRSENEKPIGMKQTVQARRLEKTDSDDPRSENEKSIGVKQIVQARRLEKADSDENLSVTDSQATKKSAADSFYSPIESVDDETDTDEPPTNSWLQHEKKENIQDKTADEKLNELLARSASLQQRQSNTLDKNNDDEEEEEEEENNDDHEKHSSEESSTESQSTPIPLGKTAFATMPLSELKDYGYELHNIQLMQPTETSPVGLKLTKQQDPLQYIITAVAKGTKADLAGLRVDDWLIKIDDKDVRLIEFSEVSQEIRQLLTNSGLINLVIARKKSPASSPTIKQVEKERTPVVPSSSRSESLSRQQAGQTPQSLLTTDITREPLNNNQLRFVPDQPQNTSTIRSQRSPLPDRGNSSNTPGGPLSVGITNPISDENITKSPRSQSRSPSHSPAREFAVNRGQKSSLTEQPSDMIDPRDIRHVTLKEALGLDFNSFIPEGDTQIQTHFISNVQSSSMADKAGLRDGDRILTVNDVDVRNAVHEDVRRMMQSKKPLQLTVVNDPKYLELIEDVKRNQSKTRGTLENTNFTPPDYETGEQQILSSSSESTGRNRSAKDSASDLPNLRSKADSPKSTTNDLTKYLNTLFTDGDGTVEVKHCLLKKEPTYNGYGLLLRYQNGLHLIDQVEQDSPAYNAGLREDDVILFVDRKNVEQMTHDDVKILIRKLSLSNVSIDLILIRKSDMQRYKIYQEKNILNWKPIFEHKLPNETEQTEQKEASSIRSINDPITVPRAGSTTSSLSGKQAAPAPPLSSSPTSVPGTRVCVLQPSVEGTAGFALSGKAPPPYVICQIEKNSPAGRAGLLLNDTLLSINGKSVTETTYEDTVKLVKEALQQKRVELVVRGQSINQSDSEQAKKDSQSSMSNPRNASLDSYDSNTVGNNDSIGGGEPSTRGANAVEEYQNRGKSTSSVGGGSSTTTTTKNNNSRR
ncbi:hypothetical protein I4U23_006673 [Adineta vaga]|nr:hypothetical protein I4U23_006673 [Adineta vaga]